MGIDRVTVVRGAAYAGIFATAAALNTVVATTWVPADVAAWISTPIWCGGLIGATLITTEKERRMAWLIAAWLVSALLMFAAVPNFWALVLHFRGEQVEATVTALRDGREKGRHLYYTLSYEGRRIPGESGRWPGSEIGAADNPEGRVDDRVTVVSDPHGLVDPRLPDELATAKAGQAPITGVLIGSLVALCCAAARPPRRNPAGGNRASTDRRGR